MAKNSKDYWADRERENLRKNLKTEAEYYEEIENIYKYTMDQIQKEIDSFYAKYASKEGISIAEAKKRASKLDMEEFSRKAKKYVEEKNFSKQANEEMRLYNLTMKVNRLELLKARIGLELVAGFDELQQFYEEKLTERTMEEFKRQAGILGLTLLDNAKMAEAIVNASFKNATFSERIWTHQDLLRAELEKALRTGLIQGRNPRELARQIRKVFNTSIFNAERLLRTELARVQTEAQKQSYVRNGFDQYTYITCEDGKVCEECETRNGKHFDIDDMMPGENAPPMHPCCRCSTAAYIDDKSYDEWLEGYSEHGLSYADWKDRNRLRMFAEKEESKRKYEYEDTVVNASEIGSARYRRKFSVITGESKVSRSLWKNALDMLDHRSGTKYEDLAFVDSKTGNAKINKNYDKENTASPSDSMKKMLRDAEPHSIIAIHNHPGSSPPSYSDLVVCNNRKYKYGLVVCHDGTIYKYAVDNRKFNKPIASSALDLLQKDGYTKDVKKQLKDAGVSLEVL